MPPKKKDLKQTQAKDEPQIQKQPVVEQQEKVATDLERTDPISLRDEALLPQVEPQSIPTEEPHAAIKIPTNQGKTHQVKDSVPAVIEPPAPKKQSVQKPHLSERDKIELRKLKFSEMGPGGNLIETARIRQERIKKFGGIRQESTDQLKKRAEKFGGYFIDKYQEKEKKLKRVEKFGKKGNNNVFNLLTIDDQKVLEQRRKKFAFKPPNDLTYKTKVQDEEGLKSRQIKYSGQGAPEKIAKLS